MISSLIWKEWHEQRWKLGFASVILVSFGAIGLRARLIPDLGVVIVVLAIACVLLPVLVSMGMIAPERASGSLAMLMALPVRPARLFAVKASAGIVLCAVPMVLTAAASWLIAGGREIGSAEMLGLYARATGVILFAYLWMLAVTVQLPSEARAGLVAAGLLVIIFLASAPLMDLPTQPHELRWLAALTPMGLFQGIIDWQGNEPVPIWAVLVTQAFIAALVWWWGARQLPRRPRVIVD
jgi:hypothetical protein